MLLYDLVLIASQVGISGIVVFEVLEFIVHFLSWKEYGFASIEMFPLLDDDFIDFVANLIPHVPMLTIDCELMDFNLFVSIKQMKFR